MSKTTIERHHRARPDLDETLPTPAEVHAAEAPGLRGWLLLVAAVALAWPWFLYRITQDYHHGPPALVALLSGLAILGAAFLLSWAAEAFQMDVSQAAALALLSLIAVMPEYAVDIVFAWRAAGDPPECASPEVLSGAVRLAAGTCQAPYAVANMTGANRLLIGIGWSTVVLLAWWRVRRRNRLPAGASLTGTVTLHRTQALELGALAVATLYSFIIPLKGGIGVVDAVVLVSLFALYAWATSRAPAEEPELVGPAAAIGSLAPVWRRAATYGLFFYSAVTIFVSAEPFAEGLVHSGEQLGINEFLLVQWLAPLASESPEFLVALLFAWRGAATAGLRTLVASKVNQWTLLIGTLGAAYSIARGHVADLPLDIRQIEELFLTSGQSLFALALIANFDLSVREALVLMGAFLVQFMVPIVVPIFFPGDHALQEAIDVQVRIGIGILYVIAGIAMVTVSQGRRRTLLQLPQMIRETIGLVPRPAPAHH